MARPTTFTDSQMLAVCNAFKAVDARPVDDWTTGGRPNSEWRRALLHFLGNLTDGRPHTMSDVGLATALSAVDSAATDAERHAIIWAFWTKKNWRKSVKSWLNNRCPLRLPSGVVLKDGRYVYEDEPVDVAQTLAAMGISGDWVDDEGAGAPVPAPEKFCFTIDSDDEETTTPEATTPEATTPEATTPAFGTPAAGSPVAFIPEGAGGAGGGHYFVPGPMGMHVVNAIDIAPPSPFGGDVMSISMRSVTTGSDGAMSVAPSSPFGGDVMFLSCEMGPGTSDGALLQLMWETYGPMELPITLGKTCGTLVSAQMPGAPLRLVFRPEVACAHFAHLLGKPTLNHSKGSCSDCSWECRPLFPCVHNVLSAHGCMHGDRCDKIHYDPDMFCRFGLIALILELLERHPELFDGRGSGDNKADQRAWVSTHAAHSRRHAQGNCFGCGGMSSIVSFGKTGWPKRAEKPDAGGLRAELSNLALHVMGGAA